MRRRLIPPRIPRLFRQIVICCSWPKKRRQRVHDKPSIFQNKQLRQISIRGGDGVQISCNEPTLDEGIVEVLCDGTKLLWARDISITSK